MTVLHDVNTALYVRDCICTGNMSFGLCGSTSTGSGCVRIICLCE